MPSIGPLELIVVLVIALVVFGPKRLPDLGRSPGQGMREFKDSITGGNDEDDHEDDDDEADVIEAKAGEPAATGPRDTK